MPTPGTPTSRYFHGDLRLYHHGEDHVEEPLRAPPQEHQGVDQDRIYLVPSSPSHSLNVHVSCLAVPNSAAVTAAGWKAQVAALRRAREARAERLDPLVWVARDDLSTAVSAWAAPNLTCPGNTYGIGDVLLVRRLGVGLWSLVSVTGVPGGGVVAVAAVSPTALHAIQNGDEVHLVEAYYQGMAWTQLEPIGPGRFGGWVSERLSYGFRGAGLLTYNRTASSVGS